ncbi:uncharacterized protein LOC123683775 isoform X2 [Harmonia axyridis]|uniref:uncharacterized protein LOC123683775 isoform X2 n=1 Tax=Harmonia axyridis TaxID=115357 RepID=UPI001E277C12|nr:uncharacterized protein LOC123683775 isoform X2 [Harmonia axyridis]
MEPTKESNVENKVDSVNKDQPDDKSGDEHQKESENEVTTNSDEQEEIEKDQEMESEAGKEIDSEKHTEMEKGEHVEAENNERIEPEKTENKMEDPLKSNEQVDSEKLVEDGSSQKTSEDGISKETSGDCANNEAENSQSKETENGIAVANTEDNSEKMQIDENEEDEDDDFNPLLLCPDISMDVEESPVLTGSTETSQMTDTADSNSLFAPLFSTFVDEMTGAEISFNLTTEEQQLRGRLYGPNNPIQFTKIHCTACNVHLGSALAGQTNRFVHPLLKVLICKECYHFYTSGEFEKDEDGSELYCRWCGQGGQVLCCTMCEFVFCKKCIRINFGRKKLTQVRDSDDWKCFRCDMSQLKALRAMCVEFFEYIRRETARAASYTDTDIVNKDHTNCCQGQNKKRSLESDKETEKEVVRRPKRRRNEEEDPDYNPYVKEDDDVASSSLPSTSGVKAAANVSKPILIHGDAAKIQNEMKFSNQSPPPTVRIGNTVLNVKGLGTLSPVNMPPLVSRNTAIRTPVQQTYIKPKPAFTPRSSHPQTPNPRPAVTPNVHIRTPVKPPLMKHEWFEKTVRAAARVNSNLSYTLTQLNKAQSSASSVEQLAVVHNKLQEILSSSINSLIQIRKNLRTEFIAGIKTIRFPPKQAVDPNDDDVIIVNTETSTSNSTQNNKMSMPAPSQNTAKRLMKQKSTVNSSTPTTTANNTPSKGYLKVRSFSQLQSVSSECITIPDDDPPPNPEPIVVEVSEDVLQESARKDNNDKEAVKETEKKTDEKDKNEARQEKDKSKDVGDKDKVKKKSSIETSQEEGNNTKDEENNTKDKENEDECVQNGEKTDKDKTEKEENSKTNNCESNGKEKDSNDSEKCNGEVKVKTEPEEHCYNVNDNPTPKIRRMLSVKVNLKKTPVIENLVKKEPVENGDN